MFPLAHEVCVRAASFKSKARCASNTGKCLVTVVFYAVRIRLLIFMLE